MEMKKIAKEAGLALGVSFLVTILFLVVIALAALKAGWEEHIISGIMIAVYVLAPALGGFLMGKKRKVNRFLWGLGMGVLYFAVYAVIAVTTKDAAFGETVGVMIPVCLGGMAGGMLS